ncbi:MAG: bifunctional 5,10-methylenetetrahydrofolate dehydrogenase/5,10-methenyltetrahydrofolate cyclohydrolase, partial [Alphaproteobacteria bacterium]
HINEKNILLSVNPKKDIDCLHPLNVGNLIIGNSAVLPCTPQGVLTAIKSVKKNISGLNAVIIGRSNIVGKPLVPMLLNENCSVSILHSKTKYFSEFTKKADIIVMAVGVAKMLKAEHVKVGVIVIDVGINRIDKKIIGDVDFENVQKKALAITPVPKGIGPLTIAFLMKNIFLVSKK